MFKRKKSKKDNPKLTAKRQWGSEKNMVPLPWLHEHPSTTKLVLSRLAIFLTVFFWITYILSIVIKQLVDSPKGYDFTMEAFSYAAVVTFLTFSALMYLVARLGAFERFSKHVRVPHSVLENHFNKSNSGITVLVPSYDEEPSVIRKTLFSAAIQEYPHKKVVLLLDDNPNPTTPEALERLNQTRAIAKEIQDTLSIPYKRFNSAFEYFEKNTINSVAVPSKVIHELSKQYWWAADYLFKLAEQEKLEDHVDVFFKDQVLKELANDLKLVSQALDLATKEEAKL